MDGSQREIGASRFLTLDTNLRLNSWNSLAGVTLTVICRRVDLDGNLRIDRFDQVPNSDRTIKQSIFDLSAGWLVGVQVFASAGAPVRGQCFVRVELIRGDSGAILPLETLVQDYVQNSTGSAWPGSILRSSIEGPGFMRSILGTDPAAGVEVSEVVPAATRWRLVSLQVALVTSAVVASRAPALTFDDGVGATFGRYPNAGTIAASASSACSWGSGVGVTGSSNGISSGIPSDLFLPAAWRIKTSTGAIDVADNYGPPQYMVEEWIVPA